MRRWIVACVWVLAVLGSMAGLRAQVPESPHFRVLGPRDGLPSSGVNGLDRDSAGFLWIATTDGLARYDGNGFRIWRHQVDDPRSLTGNWVQAVHVDARDRVWTASEFGGFSMLDARRDGFRHWRRATTPQLGSDDIFAIASRGDTLWLGTGDAGLYRMSLAGDPSTWKPERIEGLPSDTVINLDVDRQGRLWIATVNGVAVLDKGKIRTEALPGDDPAPMVYSVVADGGRVWVGTSAGIFRRAVDGTWTRLPYADMFERPNAATSLSPGAGGTLWIGSQRQLWRVERDDAIPGPVTTDPPYQPGTVQVLMRQPDGGLWVALPGLGLGYLRSDWRAIAQLRKREDGQGLSGGTYRVAAPARAGGMWLAAVDGHVERVDASGVVERIAEDIRLQLPTSKPMTMVEDKLGQLWLFFGRTGLWRIGRDGRLDDWQVGERPDDLQDGQYTFLEVAGDGTLWAAIPEMGFEQRDIATGKVIRRIGVADAGITDGDVEDMKIGPDGRIWISGSFGVGWLDRARGKLVVPAGLASPGKRVFVFDFSSANDLWLYRLDGLVHHRRGDDTWREFERAPTGQQLSSLQPSGLEVDERGRVWLTSQRGLYRWDPKRRHLDHIGMQHGLSSQEFIDRGMSLESGGMLAGALRDGSVILVDTRFPDPPGRVPELRIDGIDVRRAGAWVPQPVTDRLSFDPDDREFRLTGHLLAFDDPGGTRYWSRLEGFDKDWVEQGAQGERVFSGLGPGDYRLRMRARDAAGNIAKEQVLQFTIRPPWWRTVPALLGGALLLTGLLALLALDYRRRLNRNHALAMAEQQRAMAEQASEAKTRFLATLGHEIRTPMTGVLGMAELLQSSPLDGRQQGQVQSIHRAGKHLLRLLNDALDLARIEADKLVLSEEPFDLHALIDEVASLMGPLAERKRLRFVLERAPDLPRAVVGDRTRIEQILLNLLGNAIKFTDQGEVGLAVSSLGGEGVRFVIHDTGPGLNEEQRQRLFRRFEQAEGARTNARYGGSGLGLAISQELSAVMGGRIDLQSAPGAGACFTVDLPLKASDALPSAAEAASAQPAKALSLLLVEDDITVAEVVAGLLRTQRHDVRHAPHGLAALAEVASMRFDAALLDLDLPGMDGFTLARQLRLGGFDGPLLAVTARADAEAEPKSRQAGFDAFLRKPVTAEMLASGLRQAFVARRKSGG